MVEDESCADIADSLYGNANYARLLLRYNEVDCTRPLENGRILVLPYDVRDVPVAQLDNSTPTVRTRPPSGTWKVAVPGMSLDDGYTVNTLDEASADILFRDRSRIYLQEHTLVVIYGTASTSSVAKQERVAITLNEGELRAGLAALSGRPMDVTTSDGGQVVAHSEDTVLRRQGERTTVSVFDGHALVTNAGTSVKVPERFGTAFKKAETPIEPRPLPAAPTWHGGNRGLLLAQGAGTLSLGWSAVDAAVAYRVEVALDESFRRVVVREQVPSDVLSLEAKNLPIGAYFVRVRAVDKEDFLGIASEVATTRFVDCSVELGKLEGQSVVVSPYGVVSLTGNDDLVASVDGKAFHELPHSFELATEHPERLILRPKSGSAEANVEVPFVYERPKIELSAARTGSTLQLNAAGDDLGTLQRFAQFRFRVEQQGTGVWVDVATTEPERVAATAQVVPEHSTRVHLADTQGRVLGSLDLPGATARETPTEEPTNWASLGPRTPITSNHREMSFDWWSPNQRGSVYGTAVGATDGQGGQLAGGAVALAEPFALSLRIGTNTLAQPTPSDGSLFAHSHYQVALGRTSHLALRVGLILPATSASPAPRMSGGGSAGGAIASDWWWLANVDLRAAMGPDTDGLSATQSRAGAGALYQIAELWRTYALLDAYLLGERARGAGQLGLEFGQELSFSANARLSPWGNEHARWVFGAGLSLVTD